MLGEVWGSFAWDMDGNWVGKGFLGVEVGEKELVVFLVFWLSGRCWFRETVGGVALK